MKAICFDWRAEYSRIFGIVYRPIADIEIRSKESEWIAIKPYVDSGADISLFPRSVGEVLLGLKIESGKEHLLHGIGMQPIKSFVHDGIQMRLGHEALEIRAAFAEVDAVPHLLGRMDIFDRFNIAFDCHKRRTCFSKD